MKSSLITSLKIHPFPAHAAMPSGRSGSKMATKYVLFLAHALRSLRPGGTAGIIFPGGILFGNTTSHITVKERLFKEFDLQAVVILPNGMFEPYTPTQPVSSSLKTPADRQKRSGFSMWKATDLHSKKRASSARSTETIFLNFSACGQIVKLMKATLGWFQLRKLLTTATT